MKTEGAHTYHLESRRLLRVALWGGVFTVVWVLAVIVWFDLKARNIWEGGRRESANLMVDGLSRAIQNDLVTRNYAQLENYLKQASADAGVKSALVADPQGKVLSYVLRESLAAQPRAEYGVPAVTPPNLPRVLRMDDARLEAWVRVDSGVPVGWLRLELLATQADRELSDLRWRLSLALGLASLMLLGLLPVVMQRASRLVAERESEMQARQQALADVAFRDSLTGLPNRHLLLDRLPAEMARCRRHQERMLVCFMDLDGFKAINDTHGHELGDEVLREVGRRLTSCVRETDTVARLGGDEFVLLLPDCSVAAECEPILERILEVIRKPITIGKIEAVVSSSIGVTVFPDDGSEPPILLEHADQAMYEAKRAGKSQWQLYEEVEGAFGLSQALKPE